MLESFDSLEIAEEDDQDSDNDVETKFDFKQPLKLRISRVHLLSYAVAQARGGTLPLLSAKGQKNHHTLFMFFKKWLKS